MAPPQDTVAYFFTHISLYISLLLICVYMSLGPLLKFPVIDVQVSLHDFRAKYGTSLSMISACTAACIADALKQSSSVLLEPMMKLEVR